MFLPLGNVAKKLVSEGVTYHIGTVHMQLTTSENIFQTYATFIIARQGLERWMCVGERGLTIQLLKAEFENTPVGWRSDLFCD